MSDTYTGAVLGRLILGAGALGTTGETTILDTLIYDRTQADVDANTPKGNYNYTDLNRVEAAVGFVGGTLRGYGYDTIPINTAPKYWQLNELPRVTDTNAYCQRIATISKAYEYGAKLQLPSTLQNLDYKRANNIEEMLKRVGLLALQVPRTWHYCGSSLTECGGTII